MQSFPFRCLRKSWRRFWVRRSNFLLGKGEYFSQICSVAWRLLLKGPTTNIFLVFTGSQRSEKPSLTRCKQIWIWILMIYSNDFRKILLVGRGSHSRIAKFLIFCFCKKPKRTPKTAYDFNLDVGYSVSSYVYLVLKIFSEIFYMVLENPRCLYCEWFLQVSDICHK